MAVSNTRPYRPDFFFNAFSGYLENVDVVHKFGTNTSIGTSLEPVTSSGTYQTPTAAQSLEIVSTSVNDTVGGSGAQIVTVQGLGADWMALEEDVSLNGTSVVALTNSFTRVFRIFVKASGTYATASAGSHAGTITVQGGGGGVVWGQVEVVGGLGLSQSLIGAYTIPKGYQGTIYLNSISVDSGKSVDMVYFARNNADDVATPYSGCMRVKSDYVGVSGVVKGDLLVPVDKQVGPCDIGWLAKGASGSSSASTDFYIVLEKVDI